MINEVDETLRSLFKEEVLSGTDVDVVFEAPTRDWASRRNKPTLNLYLYDIREDLRRQQFGETEIRDEQGRVVSRVSAPRFFRLTYLVTAWTQRPEDEHRLLSATLATLLLHTFLPKEYKTEALSDPDLPLYTRIAFPPSEDRQISDVWSALGGDLKPSLDLQVDLPIFAEGLQDVASLVMGPLKLQANAFNSMEAEDDVKQLRPSEAEPVA